MAGRSGSTRRCRPAYGRVTSGRAGTGAILMIIAATATAMAQTEVGCQTAAQIVAQSSFAGSTLTLHEQYDKPEAVERLVSSRFGKALETRPDQVQVCDMGNAHFLIMASAQGCHVAHTFSDDAG
jgi:hypothetical protein